LVSWLLDFILIGGYLILILVISVLGLASIRCCLSTCRRLLGVLFVGATISIVYLARYPWSVACLSWLLTYKVQSDTVLDRIRTHCYWNEECKTAKRTPLSESYTALHLFIYFATFAPLPSIAWLSKGLCFPFERPSCVLCSTLLTLELLTHQRVNPYMFTCMPSPYFIASESTLIASKLWLY